jgi:hypothetical protein
LIRAQALRHRGRRDDTARGVNVDRLRPILDVGLQLAPARIHLFKQVTVAGEEKQFVRFDCFDLFHQTEQKGAESGAEDMGTVVMKEILTGVLASGIVPHAEVDDLEEPPAAPDSTERRHLGRQGLPTTAKALRSFVEIDAAYAELHGARMSETRLSPT